MVMTNQERTRSTEMERRMARKLDDLRKEPFFEQASEPEQNLMSEVTGQRIAVEQRHESERSQMLDRHIAERAQIERTTAERSVELSERTREQYQNYEREQSQNNPSLDYERTMRNIEAQRVELDKQRELVARQRESLDRSVGLIEERLDRLTHGETWMKGEKLYATPRDNPHADYERKSLAEQRLNVEGKQSEWGQRDHTHVERAQDGTMRDPVREMEERTGLKENRTLGAGQAQELEQKKQTDKGMER